ncbi:winged helix-turn-helix domain-containing protein [Micromonospora echinofusca]|uniref:GntR family transcriptional regulator n=1 Tax=Micromonospora echinofusca TaxID=47858 RepID=A0ABS3VUZ1_MICEH|nr:winged helix-turn-helix domain-containing protein [Micromonospora echinofusca]MBO4208203.1 GntR family transcriptional regulator [Micromonospora echinofusca]
MIDPDADQAIVEQLADLLRDRIRSGDLAPGALLPGEARLTEEYGLSRTAVQQAMALLRTEGLVSIDPTRGAFVCTSEPAETVTLLKGDTVSARLPTPVEQRELGAGDGVPVLVVFRADGSRELYSADRVRVGR